MSNPNNNKNFNDEALRINRALKKRLDKANAIVDKLLELEIYISGAGTRDYEDMLIELKEILDE
tara:strand:+ start:168 stop:359 length:192 start_codon:yes stop_codon:yes gene_type:complete